MQRTWRVTVKGRFADLDEARKQELRAGLDTLPPGFTEATMLQYDRDVYTFPYRLIVHTESDSPADAEIEASLIAGDKATTDLDARGLGYRDLRIAGVTSMDDMKINRPSRVGKRGQK